MFILPDKKTDKALVGKEQIFLTYTKNYFC